MTAVMKYAGAIALDDLEAQVKRGLGRNKNADETVSSNAAMALPGVRAGGAQADAAYGAILRFGVINLAAFALAGAAWTRGWLDTVVDADQTGLTLAIIGVFVAGFGLCGFRLWRRETLEAMPLDHSTPHEFDQQRAELVRMLTRAIER